MSASAFAQLTRNGTRRKVGSHGGSWLVPYDYITCRTIELHGPVYPDPIRDHLLDAVRKAMSTHEGEPS